MGVPKKQYHLKPATSIVAKRMKELQKKRLEKKSIEAEEQRLRDYIMQFINQGEVTDGCASSELVALKVPVSGSVSWKSVVERLVGSGAVTQQLVTSLAEDCRGDGYDRLDIRDIP